MFHLKLMTEGDKEDCSSVRGLVYGGEGRVVPNLFPPAIWSLVPFSFRNCSAMRAKSNGFNVMHYWVTVWSPIATLAPFSPVENCWPDGRQAVPSLAYP
jgi:hypothetical protein